MDPVFHMSLAGTVVGSWSLTQEVAGSSPFTVMKNILPLNSANSVKKIGKTPMNIDWKELSLRLKDRNSETTKWRSDGTIISFIFWSGANWVHILWISYHDPIVRRNSVMANLMPAKNICTRLSNIPLDAAVFHFIRFPQCSDVLLTFSVTPSCSRKDNQ